jgi:hypothetical protein
MMRPVSPKEDDTMEIEIKEKRDNPLLDRTTAKRHRSATA